LEKQQEKMLKQNISIINGKNGILLLISINVSNIKNITKILKNANILSKKKVFFKVHKKI